MLKNQASVIEYQAKGPQTRCKVQGAKRLNDLHLGCCLANDVLLIGAYQSMTEIQMTNGSMVLAWGWINHESCNTMGYNTTFLLFFL